MTLQMTQLNKNTFKAILPAIVFILFLMPIITSSLLDFEQKKKNELLLEEQRLEEETRLKIYLLGKFDQTGREDFALIPPQYVLGPNKMYLRKETLEAYLQMRNAATFDGIDLKVASATRNFEYQKELWNNKWTGIKIVEGQDLSKTIPDGLLRFQKILEYSATPGTSRHHWGTDIDINGAEPAYFDSPKGAREYEWLKKNGPSFGFCQTYTLKGSNRSIGYNEEKWHWSYLPLAQDFTNQYKSLIKTGDIKGFLGDEYAPKINLIKDYVLGINPECL